MIPKETKNVSFLRDLLKKVSEKQISFEKAVSILSKNNDLSYQSKWSMVNRICKSRDLSFSIKNPKFRKALEDSDNFVNAYQDYYKSKGIYEHINKAKAKWNIFIAMCKLIEEKGDYVLPMVQFPKIEFDKSSYKLR